MTLVAALAGRALLVVVRVSRLRVRVRQRGDGRGQERPDPVVALHNPVYDQGRLGGLTPMSLVDVRLDRHVDMTVLVLERKEADLPGRGRRLPGDDEARHRIRLPSGCRFASALLRARSARMLSR
jgi:hypothetical protein